MYYYMGVILYQRRYTHTYTLTHLQGSRGTRHGHGDTIGDDSGLRHEGRPTGYRGRGPLLRDHGELREEHSDRFRTHERSHRRTRSQSAEGCRRLSGHQRIR